MANKTKNPAAVQLGRKGGRKRMEELTTEQRKALARAAGRASGVARRAKAKKKK